MCIDTIAENLINIRIEYSTGRSDVGQIKGSCSSHTQLYVLLNEYQNPSRASNTLVIFYTVRSNRYDNKYCPHGNGHIAMCLWLLGTLMRNAPPNRAMGSIDSEQIYSVLLQE